MLHALYHSRLTALRFELRRFFALPLFLSFSSLN
jgi:hypothetical protein